MKRFIPKILKSKKAQAMIVGLLMTLFAESLGMPVTESTMTEVVALISAYIIGQGVADHGKSVKEIDADARRA